MRRKRYRRLEDLPTWALLFGAGFFAFTVWLFGEPLFPAASAWLLWFNTEGLSLANVGWALLLLATGYFVFVAGLASAWCAEALKQRLKA